MLTGKLVSTLRIVTFSVLILFSTGSMANYMVEYEPYPCHTCDGCSTGYHHYYRHHNYHHRYHRHYYHAKRRTSYRIEVFYTVVPYPDYYDECNGGCTFNPCQSCQPRPRCAPRCASNMYDGAWNGYATQPVRVVDTCGTCRGQSISYDTATADDITEY
jgi:hypothetical protein